MVAFSPPLFSFAGRVSSFIAISQHLRAATTLYISSLGECYAGLLIFYLEASISASACVFRYFLDFFTRARDLLIQYDIFSLE